MQYNKAQYNNYPRKNYGNSKDSNGGTAKLTKTKKDGLILVVKLNNQNLVFSCHSQKRIGIIVLHLTQLILLQRNTRTILIANDRTRFITYVY